MTDQNSPVLTAVVRTVASATKSLESTVREAFDDLARGEDASLARQPSAAEVAKFLRIQSDRVARYNLGAEETDRLVEVLDLAIASVEANVPTAAQWYAVQHLHGRVALNAASEDMNAAHNGRHAN